MKIYYIRRVPSTCVDQSCGYLKDGAIKGNVHLNITEFF